MHLHTSTKGGFHHLTGFYLIEVTFHWVPSQEFQTSTVFSDTCLIGVDVFLNGRKCKNTDLPKTFSDKLHQSLSGDSWSEPGNVLEVSVKGYSWWLFPSPTLHSLPKSWDQLHSSANSPGFLKLLVFLQLSPPYKWFAYKACWVCRSVVRHLLKPSAGYLEALGNQTYHNRPTRPRISTLSWAECSITIQPYLCKAQPQGGKNPLQKKTKSVASRKTAAQDLKINK